MKLSLALTGPADSPLTNLVLVKAVEFGLNPKRVAPGIYRVDEASKGLPLFEELLKRVCPDGTVALGPEVPPARTSIVFRTSEARPATVRTAEVFGSDMHELAVVRAIDAGLSVRMLGVHRFEVCGRTTDHVDWIAGVRQITREEALKLLGLNEARVRADDAPAVDVPTFNVASPTVSITNEVQPAAVQVEVALPDRQTRSVIDRDRDGNIVNVVQTETSI